LVFFLSSLLILVADQLTKAWIRTSLPEGCSLFKLGLFQITHVHNTGAAFGLFQGQSFMLTVFASITIVVILALFLTGYHYIPWLNSTSIMVLLGLILGGTAGNLIDRLRYGYVTDFIDFGYWPAFNIADSAVTVGVILLAILLLRHAQAGKR